MGDIIHLDPCDRHIDNLITRTPLEIRWGGWRRPYPIQVERNEAERFERHRRALYRRKHVHTAETPDHFPLKGGLDTTFWSLWRWRHNAERMKEVYYLAGLMECITHVPHPVLRSVVIRTYYRHLERLQEDLEVRWRGRVNHFLLPLDRSHRRGMEFERRLQRAETLQELLAAVRGETDRQFSLIAEGYVFYVPRASLEPAGP